MRKRNHYTAEFKTKVVLEILSEAATLNEIATRFTNANYLKLLDEAEVRVSMNGKGQALDNIRTERFFRTLKYDLIYVLIRNIL